MFGVANYLERINKNRKWRKNNPHNSTEIVSVVDISKVSVGRCTYGNLIVLNHNPDYKVKIGNFCSIAPKTVFIPSSDHSLSCIMTFPFIVRILGEQYEAISKGDIVVDDDVWIGYRSTILSGVHIGQGAVVAAGSVVTKDVQPYAVVAGNPAKVIKYRFEQPIIDYLLTLDYGALTEDLIQEHIDDLYRPIDDLKLDEVKTLYSWFPKKN